ncbi:putative transposase [Rubritalea squalenifaciens DSM 18772]|uniref:Putative transposase n=1 Tax=Rubritalea squalenifaciens DSM 18772 TaxID=1123071 RepID=A0A1M6GNF2_9BACT|nr:transposase [Rubritalea squalenifaciens]SHJ11449.1 putative transposase [Rubritalea squalenifaciens DSM 18772]
MQKQTHSEEQIIGILREADGGKTVRQVCKDHNISDKTYYRWKRKYGRMEVADAKRLRELEKENTELKKIVAEQLLNIKVLEHVNAKKW